MNVLLTFNFDFILIYLIIVNDLSLILNFINNYFKIIYLFKIKK